MVTGPRNVKDILIRFLMGVSWNGGTPKWLVYKGNPTKMDDLGVPPFMETLNMAVSQWDKNTHASSANPDTWIVV